MKSRSRSANSLKSKKMLDVPSNNQKNEVFTIYILGVRILKLYTNKI
jgi:hypothetical protein